MGIKQNFPAVKKHGEKAVYGHCRKKHNYFDNIVL